MTKQNLIKKLTEKIDVIRASEKVEKFTFRQPYTSGTGTVGMKIMIIPGEMDYAMRGDISVRWEQTGRWPIKGEYVGFVADLPTVKELSEIAVNEIIMQDRGLCRW